MLDQFQRGACYIFLHETRQACYSFTIHIPWVVNYRKSSNTIHLPHFKSQQVFSRSSFLFLSFFFFPPPKEGQKTRQLRIQFLLQKRKAKVAFSKCSTQRDVGFCSLPSLMSLPWAFGEIAALSSAFSEHMERA